MALLFVCVIILFLGLVLVQAWTIWYLRREVARLEFRLGEALDDEDLLEFQERLRDLLSEAKTASTQLAKTAEKQREGLEAALEKARLAEKSLALRLVARSAAEAGKRPDAAQGPAPKETRKAGSAAKAKDAAPTRGRTAAASEAPKSPASEKPKTQAASSARPEGPAGQGAAERDERRSYLVRPRDTPPSKHQGVYDLADQGLDIDAIARRSGLLAGEVDLILSLRRRPEL